MLEVSIASIASRVPLLTPFLWPVLVLQAAGVWLGVRVLRRRAVSGLPTTPST